MFMVFAFKADDFCFDFMFNEGGEHLHTLIDGAMVTIITIGKNGDQSLPAFYFGIPLFLFRIVRK